jgi:hypothetical protein
MHSQATVAQALALRAQGLGARRIAARMGLPVATIRDWLAGRLPKHSTASDGLQMSLRACGTCGHTQHDFDALPAEYVYLLGLYLGDGCISEYRRRVFRLRIFLDLNYPLIVDECERAIQALMPENRINRTERFSNLVERDEPSNVEVSAFSKSWVCLFPQHGPGKKHARKIELTDWQDRLVARWPDQLLKGLIHSDGCRFINTGSNNWSCPRYVFNQKSDDIRAMFCHVCDLVGVHWTQSGTRNIYVSRKADVAHLDTFIGPKR